MLGDAKALAVLLDEAFVDEVTHALADPAAGRSAEVRAGQPNRLRELVDVPVGRVPQRPEQVVVEIHTCSVATPA